MTRLVCFAAFHQASRDLERAQLRCRVASRALERVRSQLDQVLNLAYQQQSFGPLNTLFDEEEVALAIYQRAVVKLTEAEERWCALRVALAYERELMRKAQPSRRQLN